MTYVLGLDLGTTASAAAINADGEVSMLTVGHQSLVIPSVVHLGADGALVVGEAAERRARNDPGGVAREFKRRFGDPQPLILNGSPVAANDLMLALASHLVEEASTQLGDRPAGIVVGHPANWGDYKVALLSDTLTNSNLPPHRLITEPVAAAVHGASQERIEPGSVIAVYDLGGGTFDVALLRRLTDGWELVGRPGGIERLGGIDFDSAVIHHVVSSLGLDLTRFEETDTAAVAAMNRLREECRSAKHALSEDTAVTIPVFFPGVADSVRLTRNEFESLIAPAVARTLEVFDTVVSSAALSPEDIDRVLLVGGSTRIPFVHQRVLAHCVRPVTVDRHPKHAIALGAAATATTATATGPIRKAAAEPPAAPMPPAAEPPAAPGPATPAPAPADASPPADMYRLPFISEAPLPDFLRRRAEAPPPTGPTAGPNPLGPAPAPTIAVTRVVPGPVPPARTSPPVPSGTSPPIGPDPGIRPAPGAKRRSGRWLVVLLIAGLSGIAAALVLREQLADATASTTGDDLSDADDATDEQVTPATSSTVADAPSSTAQAQIVLGVACPPALRPDPTVTYRVSEIPDGEPEQALNGRNIPSIRAIDGIESVAVTTFAEFSELDLTYADCVVDERGRAWWGVHFEGGLVWSSTLFIEPAP